MTTVDDLQAAIEHVKDCAGDQTWLTGLTLQDVSGVATMYGASQRRLDELIARIHHQYPDLFDHTTGAMVFPAVQRPGAPPPANPPGDQPPQTHQEGDAADAIRSAEAALAQQNSATAQIDLQTIVAILNAHLKTVEGKEALGNLQREIESAVRTRTDLDSPAGARDFQRFLISKLKEIRAVVAAASLDDTSKSALLAALTALYNASQDNQSDTTDRGVPAVSAAAPSPSDSMEPSVTPDELDPYFDSPLADDADVLPGGPAGQAVTPMPPPVMPTMPSLGGIPALGGAAMPGGGAMPGLSLPSGSSLPGLFQDAERRGPPQDVDDAELASEDPACKDAPLSDDGDGASTDDNAAESPESPAAGPTTVRLPNGETVTAASPELAAAIEAAVGGAPIADAFRQQGITIPPPGTAVTDPIDPGQVSPGDIGMFTDRHALALGNSQTLLNGQIQHISTVQGPSFLGWEHPPVPVTATAPTKTEPPTPTRPAAVAGTS